MATLQELKSHIEAGGKIRRSIWVNTEAYIAIDHHSQFKFNDAYEIDWSMAWIFAEDWEIFIPYALRG